MDSREAARAWLAKIEAAERRDNNWQKRGEKIVKRYRDDRKSDAIRVARFNILWSNIQTLKPAIYSKRPTPIVERRFLDPDPVGRTAAMILERGLRYEIEDNGFDDAMHQAVLDYLLPGRGSVWVRFEPQFGESVSLSPSGDDELEEPGAGDQGDEEEANGQALMEPQELVGASVCVDYQPWKDLLLSEARTWQEVEWLARRLYMTRTALVKRFGKDIGDKIALTHTPAKKPNRMSIGGDADTSQAIVWEIWDKAEKKVYFVSDGYDELIEERDDPLRLEGFWPMPRPMFATLTNETLEPVPDYAEYQDQAQELDNLTARIDLLQKALRVVGVYDASAKGLQRLLTEGLENQMVPVESWAAFAEKGGLKGAVSWLPMEEVATTMTELYGARDRVKADLYEITGLSDIVRGQGDPNETATAQQIKGRFASQRLQDRQNEVARYARDVIRIMGEVMAEQYPPERLIEVSSAMYDQGIGMALKLPQAGPQAPMQPQPGQMTPQGMGSPPGAPMQPPGMPGQPQMGMAPQPPAIDPAIMQRVVAINRAIDLLRNEKQRGFRIDIETDSTVAMDATSDKQSAIEFIKVTTDYLSQAAALGSQLPQAVPLLGKLLLFGVRNFRVGRDLESSVEEFVDMTQQQMEQRQEQPPQPDPEQIKAQAEIQTAQIDAKGKMIDAQAEAAKSQSDIQIAAMEGQIKRMELALQAAGLMQQAAQAQNPQPAMVQ